MKIDKEDLEQVKQEMQKFDIFYLFSPNKTKQYFLSTMKYFVEDDEFSGVGAINMVLDKDDKKKNIVRLDCFLKKLKELVMEDIEELNRKGFLENSDTRIQNFNSSIKV